MNANLDKMALDIVAELLEVPIEHRAARLSSLCDDSALRARVISLLEQANEDPGAYVESTRIEPRAPEPTSVDIMRSPSLNVGQVGPYKIIRIIGAGGMGEVYEAEQERPRRRVALKVLRAARLTPALQKRFEYEAEWLGRLDHPGIARVHEAGTTRTPNGVVPYFAMELVSGKRLDKWLAEEQRPLSQRMRLLIDLCNAVQHAHQKGLIHRDLKPANIFVTADGAPKILDFGVARALASESALGPSSNLHTLDGALVGTVQYMSPEQAAGDVTQLDTRSDVYALGMIAYEILARQKPYDTASQPLPRALEIIRTAEPPRMGAIDRQFRGDIETIVAKALEKEKERRYASAADFGADLLNTIEHRPIRARPATLAYQFRKFARRHTAVVVASSLVALSLLGGIAGTTYGLIRANRATAQAETQRQRAEVALERAQRERDRAESAAKAEAAQRREAQDLAAVTEQVNTYMNNIFRAADPRQAMGKDVLVKDVLDRASEQLEKEFADQPLVKSGIHNSLGATYHALGLYDKALPHLRAAYDLIKNEHDARAENVLANAANIPAGLYELGKYADAEAVLREILPKMSETFGADDPRTLRSLSRLGLTLHAMGRHAEAALILKDALERYTRVAGEDDPDRNATASNLSLVYLSTSRSAEAEPLLRATWERLKKSLGEDNPETLASQNNLRGALHNMGKLEEAEAVGRDLWERCRFVLGENHPHTLLAQNNLASVLSARKQFDAADEMYRDALKRMKGKIPDDHPLAIQVAGNIGANLGDAGKNEEAEPFLRDAADRTARVRGDEHPATINCRQNLADTLVRINRPADAIEILAKTLPIAHTKLGDSHPYTVTGEYIRAKAAIELKDRAAAEDAFKKVLAGCEAPGAEFTDEQKKQYRQKYEEFLATKP